MRASRSRHPVVASLSLGAVAALLIVAACETPPPSEPNQPLLPGTPAAAIQADTAGLDGVYFEYQVETPAAQAPNSAAPLYPDVLRQAGLEGEVMVQFVVDENGIADTGTFKVLKSSHDGFTNAVRAALPLMRYTPALVRGKPVKQLVQQPFGFAIRR